MRKITLLISLIIFGYPNDDDCQGKKSEINTYYDKQIQYARYNPANTGINYRQIGLLNDERNKKLAADFS